MSRNNLNFVARPSNLRLLQAVTLTTVLGCVALGSSLLFGGGSGGSATIADTIAEGSAAPKPIGVVGAEKPKALSENAAVSATLGLAPDTIRYYEEKTGKAFSVALTTLRTEVLSDKRLPGFIHSYWIPRTEKVISAFQVPSGIEYRFFDYATTESSVLGSDFSSFAVSPDGRSIARLNKVTDNSHSLVVSSPDGSSPRTLLTTRAQEPRLIWKSNDVLSVISRRSDRPGHDLSLVGMDGTLVPLLVNKENLDVAWSPDGRYLLYSYFEKDVGISLVLRDTDTGSEIALGLETSARKCAWHRIGEAVTCGVPDQNSFSRDVPADETATIDDIYTYDFDNNTLRRIYDGTPGTLIGVTAPLLSSSGNYFVFRNMFDSRLYILPL